MKDSVDRCLHVHLDAVVSNKGRKYEKNIEKLAKAEKGFEMRTRMGG